MSDFATADLDFPPEGPPGAPPSSSSPASRPVHRSEESAAVSGERGISPISGRFGVGKGGKALALVGLLAGSGVFLAATWSHPHGHKARTTPQEPAKQVVDFASVRATPPAGAAAPVPSGSGGVSPVATDAAPAPTLADPGSGAPDLGAGGQVAPAPAVGAGPTGSAPNAAAGATDPKVAAAQRGVRCQVVVPPAAEHVSLTLRKPCDLELSLEHLEGAGLFETTKAAETGLTQVETELLALHKAGAWRAFLERAVETRQNILISGATGSGKTTLAKSLVRRIPAHERILTIEDARELTMPHRNVVHLLYSKDGQGLAKVGPKALLESALRMRPDRILLQELRDGSAFFYLRQANTGHPGSITTIHADSASLAYEQLMLLVRESEGGRDLPREDIKALLFLLVDVVVQLKRVDGRFRMTELDYEPLRKRRATH